MFRNSGNDGFHAGRGAQALNFVNCYFDGHAEAGLRTFQMSQISFLGGGARNNGWEGLYLQSPPDGIPVGPGPCYPLAQKTTRGMHYVHGMHFEGNGNGGIRMVGNAPAVVRNCRFVGNDLVLANDNDVVLVENNLFVSGASLLGSTSQGLVRYNYR
ncbi:MAG TPA: hypothetical protein VF188_09370 [Longimicrobiales bacterium]